MTDTTITAPSIETQSTAPSIETPPTAPTPEEAKPDKLTSRFVELAKREKKALELERQAKEAASKWAETEAKYKEWEQTRSKVKEQPIKALELLGVNFNDLVKSVIEEGQPESLDAKVARLEKEREEERQKQQEQMTAAQKAEEERIISSFKQQIQEAVGADLDNYELINVGKAYDTVFEVIQEHWTRTNQVMSIPEAAKMVEDYLYEESLNKIKSSKKLAKVFEKAEPKAEEKKAISSTTLTPSQLSSVVAPVSAPKTETRSEKVERIARQLLEKKKAAK